MCCCDIVEASLATLKQMATLKLQQVPQLTTLLPYIDLVPNQEYLICRIRGYCEQLLHRHSSGLPV